LAERSAHPVQRPAMVEEFITLEDAAALVGKKPSNISYLVQYNRLRRYDASGKPVRRAPSGGLRVSRSELLVYVESWNRRVRSRLEELRIGDTSIAFLDVPERERTRHVHRLHPYLGKFIPQLVGHFLSRYFEPGQVVLDPFCGSGTTLVEATERGVHSVGVEVSEFNVMIARVKLAEYEVSAVEREVTDASRRTAEFSALKFPELKGARPEEPGEDGDYLSRWFAPRSLGEMLYFRSIIPEYRHQDLLRVLLSRTVRSCRLVHHYDLATPKEPVRAPYRCYKHLGRTCSPVTTIIPRLRFYSADTVRRISEFQKARRPVASCVVEGDSRSVRLAHHLASTEGIQGRRIDGIFTSPPYVGQIDYHEQHRYAYELFGIERRDGLEIGPKTKGKGEKARSDYSRSMVESLRNVSEEMSPGAAVLLVANDKLGLYPRIFQEAGMRVERRFERPVEDRTERDKRPYSETVFLARLEG
jgi:DNA methylase